MPVLATFGGTSLKNFGFSGISDQLPITSGLFAWYDGNSFSGSTWADKTGNGRNATSSGTITVSSTTGNGATKTFQTLSGTTASTMTFPTGVLPSTYTLFHVTRYSGATRRRIYSNLNAGDWLSGFWNASSGVSYHGSWMTPAVGSNSGYKDSFSTNWVISTDQNFLYRANGAVNGLSASINVIPRLGINIGTSETSDWASSEVIIYNRTLSETEYVLMENYLATKYGITVYTSTAGTLSTNPVTTSSSLASLPSGNYWIKPTGIGSAQQLYVNNNDQSGGWALIAKGRQDNTGNGWWNNNDYQTSLLTHEQTYSTNTISVAKMNTTFINALIGGSWNGTMRFMVNRELGDSWRYNLPNARSFAWTDFGSNTVDDSTSPTTGDLNRYSAHWWGGSNTNNGSGVGMRDYMPANDATRTFTWFWSGHNPWRGWSAGNTVSSPGFMAGSEGHAIQNVQVYVKY
jgi:hypothetical protein